MQLKDNTFVFVDVEKNNARLTMLVTYRRVLTTTDERERIDASKLWQVIENPQSPGYYYIQNIEYDASRITTFNDGNGGIDDLDGDNHLWRFEKFGGMYSRKAKFTF